VQSPSSASTPHPSALGALAALAPPSAPALGWREHVLPDGGAYWHHADARATADAPLRDAGVLARVQACTHAEPGPPAQGRGEVWVRDAGKGVLARLWVDHAARTVVREKQGGGVEQEDRESSVDSSADEAAHCAPGLDAEYRYWSFVDAHPAHIALAREAVQEATDIVSWSESGQRVPRLPLVQ
jgi:hypothetical protein